MNFMLMQFKRPFPLAQEYDSTEGLENKSNSNEVILPIIRGKSYYANDILWES